MLMVNRRATLLGMALCATLLGAASTAWACVPGDPDHPTNTASPTTAAPVPATADPAPPASEPSTGSSATQAQAAPAQTSQPRSEERRVGKECRL